jgi:putative endonuclease
MASTYILSPQSLDKYYIGHTQMTVEQRVSKHLTDHNSFSAQAKDWQIVWTRIFDEKSEAYPMERKIKKLEIP